MLKARDATLKYESAYKAEYTYDMTKRPPKPFLDKGEETKGYPVRRLDEALKVEGRQAAAAVFASRGCTRRPSVVIVKDP